MTVPPDNSAVATKLMVEISFHSSIITELVKYIKGSVSTASTVESFFGLVSWKSPVGILSNGSPLILHTGLFLELVHGHAATDFTNTITAGIFKFFS